MSNPLEIRLRLEDERSLPVLLEGQAAEEVKLRDNGDGTYSITGTVQIGAIRDAGAVPNSDFVVESINAMLDELHDLDDRRIDEIVDRALKRVEAYSGRPDREGIGGNTPADGWPDKARKAWEAGVPPRDKVVIEAIMDAQAELQNALGMLRMISEPDNGYVNKVEGYFAKSLAWLHAVLDAVGKPMYQPATHPDVPATLARDDD